jgi:hypothetical protein
VSGTSDIPVSRVEWKGAVRIIRSAFPPIDLFEDIADPADWPLLISAEQKTNPRIMATIGNLDLVPIDRRVGGNGASYLMAPFTHVSTDRPSRFTDGSYGVLYVGDRSRPRCSRRSITMLASWHGQRKHLAGPRSSGRSSCQSMLTCMISELQMQNRPRCWTLTATRHLKLSLPISGARDQTGLPTRASGIPVGNASLSSTRTARQIPSKGGTSTTTGMARALTLSAMPVRGLFSVS